MTSSTDDKGNPMTDMQKLRDEFDESAAREVAKKELLKARLIPAGLSLMESLFISGARWQAAKDQAAHALQAEKIKVLESEVASYRQHLETFEESIRHDFIKRDDRFRARAIEREQVLKSCLKIAMDALTAANGMILKGWAGNLSCCEIALEQITAKMEDAK